MISEWFWFVGGMISEWVGRWDDKWVVWLVGGMISGWVGW